MHKYRETTRYVKKRLAFSAELNKPALIGVSLSHYYTRIIEDKIRLNLLNDEVPSTSNIVISLHSVSTINSQQTAALNGVINCADTDKYLYKKRFGRKYCTARGCG